MQISTNQLMTFEPNQLVCAYSTSNPVLNLKYKQAVTRVNIVNCVD